MELDTTSSASSSSRELWGSRLGFVMAAVGSAVGLGNMWRFPYRTADGGGAAFVVLYLGMTLLIGVPMMIAEFGVGRRTRVSSIGAVRQIAGPRWMPLGYLFVLTSLLIVSYLSVITGWTIRYAVEGLLHGYAADSAALYAEVSTGLPAIWYHLLVIGLTVGIVLLGVKRGIERTSMILMPILFVILVSLAVWASTLDGAGQGYAFYLTPSVSDLLDPSVLQSAASQAFFSLSVGMGIMLTYGSYLSGRENLPREALVVSMADLVVAFTAGLVVFPVIFALGVSGEVSESTVGTLFISLPRAFLEMETVGRLVGVSFFLALAVASITSTVSLLEVVASAGIDEAGWGRRAATIAGGLLAAVIGTVSALSPGVFTVLDKVAGELFVIVGVLGTAIMVGWCMKSPASTFAEGAPSGAAGFVAGVMVLIRFVIPPLLAVLAVLALMDTVRTLRGL